MQVVIDIDKAVYKAIKETMQTKNRHLGKTMMLEHLMEVINEGTPLPKGHGDLIDKNELIKELSVVSHRPVKSQMYIIKQAPTIIEADADKEADT